MKRLRSLHWFSCLILLCGMSSAAWAEASSPFTPQPPSLNDAVAGQELAAELRDARPSSNVTFRGVLKIRQHGRSTVSVPLVSKVITASGSWQSVYQAWLSDHTETLVVVHAAGQPNEYRYGRGTGTNCVANPPPLPHGRIWQPFAGSDFYLADLGLEFFHWPKQVLLKNEMRKSRACHVLESAPSVTNAYSRVVSWVDVETDGLLMADAYGPADERVKEFEVKSFKKVDDQWQLREMEIRNLKDRSRTILEFELQE